MQFMFMITCYIRVCSLNKSWQWIYPITSSSSPVFFAQGQILHRKHRNLVCSSAKGRSSTANPGSRLQFYQGLNRCSSLLLLSAPYCLFSIWTDPKWSERIPGAPTWRREEWIWLTGPTRLNRNSPQVSNITVLDQIRDLEMPPSYNLLYTSLFIIFFTKKIYYQKDFINNLTKNKLIYTRVDRKVTT